MRALLKYFALLKPGKVVLWCYLIWYGVTVALLFDPSPRIWINSFGISAIIGFALLLSVNRPAQPVAADRRWQVFRLFMMPFGVSSFSSLIKDQGYLFIFPTNAQALALSAAACTLFVSAVYLLKKAYGVGPDLEKQKVPSSTR